MDNKDMAQVLREVARTFPCESEARERICKRADELDPPKPEPQPPIGVGDVVSGSAGGRTFHVLCVDAQRNRLYIDHEQWISPADCYLVRSADLHRGDFVEVIATGVRGTIDMVAQNGFGKVSFQVCGDNWFDRAELRRIAEGKSARDGEASDEQRHT